MKNLMEKLEETDDQLGRAALAFLLHFLPVAKLDEHSSDKCLNDLLKLYGCHENKEKSSSCVDALSLQLPKEDRHAV